MARLLDWGRLPPGQYPRDRLSACQEPPGHHLPLCSSRRFDRLADCPASVDRLEAFPTLPTSSKGACQQIVKRGTIGPGLLPQAEQLDGQRRPVGVGSERAAGQLRGASPITCSVTRYVCCRPSSISRTWFHASKAEGTRVSVQQFPMPPATCRRRCAVRPDSGRRAGRDGEADLVRSHRLADWDKLNMRPVALQEDVEVERHHFVGLPAQRGGRETGPPASPAEPHGLVFVSVRDIAVDADVCGLTFAEGPTGTGGGYEAVDACRASRIQSHPAR